MQRRLWALARIAGLSKEEIKQMALNYSGGRSSSVALDSPIWYQDGGGSSLLKYLEGLYGKKNAVVGADPRVCPSEHVGADPRVCPERKGRHVGLPQHTKEIAKIKALTCATLGFSKESGNTDWNRVTLFVQGVLRRNKTLKEYFAGGGNVWHTIDRLPPDKLNHAVTIFEQILRDKDLGRSSELVKRLLEEVFGV